MQGQSGLHVVCVEDHPDIADILALTLTREGYRVSVSHHGIEGFKLIQGQQPGLVILDIMLPGMDGFEICQKIRKEPGIQGVPVVMLSARGTEADIVKALELGADDYLVKPFSPNELLARVKAVLRRGQGRKWLEEVPTKQVFEGLVLDMQRREVTVDGNLVKFTLTEFELLRTFLEKRGKIFTRDQLIDRMKGHEVVIIDRNVDVHVSAIRKKIGDYGVHIQTIRGIGYRFDENLSVG